MSMRTLDSSYASSRNDYSKESAESESISVIDRFSNFDGTYRSTRDVRIEGQVKGTIDCKGTLHIAQGASVDATIDAENISVAGELSGEINCRGRLQIMPSGRVRGKINTVTLVINEGAFYEGELEMAVSEPQLGAGRSSRSRSSLSSGGASSPTNGSPSAPVPLESTDTAPSPNVGGSGGGSGNTFIRRFGGQETSWDQGGAENLDDDPGAGTR